MSSFEPNLTPWVCIICKLPKIKYHITGYNGKFISGTIFLFCKTLGLKVAQNDRCSTRPITQTDFSYLGICQFKKVKNKIYLSCEW